MMRNNADWLASKYADLNTSELARELQCSDPTVRRWLVHHGIPIKSRSEGQLVRNSTRSKRRGYGRNRQMVTGKGFSDSLLGSIKHLDAGGH